MVFRRQTPLTAHVSIAAALTRALITLAPSASAQTTPAAPPQVAVPGAGEQLLKPGVVYQAAAGVPAPPAVPAMSYVVADAETGDVLLASNAHSPSLPASTLKALTAVTLLPKLDPAQKIIAEDDDIRVDGTKVGLMPKSDYTVEQLFQALLMSSANDAAQALARVNGGVEQTLQEMNDKAKALGMANTHAATPSGLDGPGQATTAYDLALLGRAATKNRKYVTYAMTKTAQFPREVPGTVRGRPSSGPRESYQISNHNKLLWNFPGTIGVKNGYTIAAGHTYVGAATQGGHTLVVSYLKATTSSWRVPAGLLTWAFKHRAQLAPVGTLNNETIEGAEPAASAAPAEAAENSGQNAATEQTASQTSAVSSLQQGRGTTTQRVILAGVAGGVLVAAWLLTRRRRHFHY